MSAVLLKYGATIIGYSLAPVENSMFPMLRIESQIHSILADIRDFEQLHQVLEQQKPDIIFHMAAQPIVRESYRDPHYTYQTNVMGTVNLMEAIRTATHKPQSVVNITTDKVYQNNEWSWGYRENEMLNGYDPYSNSKSCSELVTSSYINSFFKKQDISISTARAGNVIGGGDYADDRIVPDCIRAAQKKKSIYVRNPSSIRPYQHVLEPVFAYLLIAQRQYEDRNLASSFNIGPDESDCITTGRLAELFCDSWGEAQKWHTTDAHSDLHEANFLKLDCSKVKTTFGWKPKWNAQIAIQKTVEWQKSVDSGMCPLEVTNQQIESYC